MYLKSLSLVILCILLCLLFIKSKKPVNKERKEQPSIAAAPVNYDAVLQIPLPSGFKRPQADEFSFAFWLQQVKLKKDKTVYLYDGSRKINQLAQFAVLDISVGKQNLQQCADAVMRLRAEYLYSIKKYNQIRFIDNEGGVYQFLPHQHFNSYLQKVFAMCGTASLSKQMKAVNLTDIQQGDVLIRGGFPGHAVMVMDVAVNNKKEKIYLLAQSYMPAQDIHILKNPVNDFNNPWYKVTEAALIETPEYQFRRVELKRW
jgi:Domain of unknown function (4846)